jgi:predicted Zn-dependent protease
MPKPWKTRRIRCPQAHQKRLPLEVRQRLQEFLKNRDKDAIRKLRAIEVLELIGTAEARQVLETLAKEAPNPRVAEATLSALHRLAKRSP